VVLSGIDAPSRLTLLTVNLRLLGLQACAIFYAYLLEMMMLLRVTVVLLRQRSRVRFSVIFCLHLFRIISINIDIQY